MTPPVTMTIAGSDSSGSSGVQADLPTLSALGTHALTAITVVTAQNSRGVAAFHPLPVELVEAQIDTLLDDVAPVATKTGLLLQVAVIDAVRTRRDVLGTLVVDPVMVDSSGARIVSEDAVGAYRALCAEAAVVTPNRLELELLLGADTLLDSIEAVRATSDRIRALGAPMVVVTGGRGGGEEVVDLVVTDDTVTQLTSTRVGSGPIRGTGCTFSAALTSALAQGAAPVDAAKAAHDFVQGQLELFAVGTVGSGLPGLPHISVP